MEISNDLRCVFSGEVDERDGRYVIEVPDQELSLGGVEAGEVYRVAVLAAAQGSGPSTEGAVDTAGPDADTDVDGTEREAATATGDEAGPAGGTDGEGGHGGAGARSHERSGMAADGPEPPVERGEELTVDIEDIGDQGDGIARVDRGYVVIVPGTDEGERVTVEITSVKQNVAFAEVLERKDYYE